MTALIQRYANLYADSFRGISRPVWLLAWVMLINRAGSMVLPFLSLYLTKELGFSLERAAIVLSIHGVGSLFGTYFGGLLSDHIGYLKVLYLSLISSGIAFIGLMFVHDFYGLCILLFVTIALADAFRPANMAAIAAVCPPDKRNRAIGLIRLAVNLGFSIGPALGGFIVYSMGYIYIFLVDGITCILAGIAILIFFVGHRFKKYDKAAEKEISEVDESHLVKNPWKDSTFLMLLGLVMLVGVVFIQFFITVPVFMEGEVGMTEKDIGLLMAAAGLIIVLVEMPIIHGIKSGKNMITAIIIGTALIGMCYLTLSLGQTVLIAWSAMLFVTFGEIFNLPFVNVFALNRAPKSSSGKYMGLYGVAWSLCHILAPNIGFGLIYWGGYNTLWLFCAIIAAIACIGFYFLRHRLTAHST